MHQVYAKGADAYTGRVTVPVLWDKGTGLIINNESADIVRALGDRYAPGRLINRDNAGLVERWNDLIYSTLNNGVYRAGFARTQDAYEEAVVKVFAALDRIEAHLAQIRFLAGDTLSEADIRLFPTLARFDVAYHSAFKCNLKRLIDYPNLWAYSRDIYQTPTWLRPLILTSTEKAIIRRPSFEIPSGLCPLARKMIGRRRIGGAEAPQTPVDNTARR